MTIILVHHDHDHVFVAADSCRWDTVFNQNIGPVDKIHVASEASGVAIAGIHIDRTALGQKLVRARRLGEPFPVAARRISAALFEEKRVLLEKAKVRDRTQNAGCIYIEAGAGRCELAYHQLPEDLGFSIPPGIFTMGMDQAAVDEMARRTALRLANERREICLDLWARDVIAWAASKWRQHVAFPVVGWLFRTDAMPAQMVLIPNADAKTSLFNVALAPGI